MRINRQEIITYIRKALMLSIRTGYRSASDHPFVLGMVFSLLLLYKFLPSLFGFLVSSSPVIICTALLLGALLSFGQPNIPEIEEEEEEDRTTLTISSLRVGAISDDLVVKKDESSSTESHVENRREIEETPAKEADSSGGIVCKTQKEVLFSTISGKEMRKDEAVVSLSSPLEEEKEHIHSEKKVAEEREFHDKESFEKVKPHETKLMEGALEVGEYVRLTTKDVDEIESLKAETSKPSADSFLDSSIGSSWKLVDRHDACSDSDSDRAESSSPDASMADIIPMLDELHPLLDSEPLQPAHASNDESDAASGASSQDHESDVGSVDEEAENQEEEEGEEEAQEEKDGGASVAVKWTADDEKNLMDLGTSELERNQRLENLIAKRRARKNLRFETEKNLIDLDNNDSMSTIEELSRLLVQIPHLSTTRRNPFDLPYDSEDCSGLPPIPGSAPSVLLPRRNPFDLPYDQADESGSLARESLRDQEFVAVPHRETLFRRHESFALGASFLGEHRQDRRDFKLRPYFVTDRMDLEERSYAQFQRQLSEKSDSKVSSVPESESVSSVADHEFHREQLEQELHQRSEFVFISPTSDAKPIDRESQSSDEVDSTENEHELGESNAGGSHELDANVSRAMEGDTPDVTDVFTAVEEEIGCEMELSSLISDAAKSEVIEENDNESSSSSSSDVDRKNFNINNDEDLSNMQQKRGGSSKSPSTTMRSVIAESDLRSTAGQVGDTVHVEEPVYDSSPSAIETSLSNLSSLGDALLYGHKGSFNSTSTISSDMQVETSEMGSPSRLVERNVFSEVHESVTGSGSMGEEPVSGDGGFWVASSALSSVEENESRSKEVHEIREDDVIQDGIAEFHEENTDPIAPAISEPAVEQIVSSSSSSSMETASSEESAMDKEGSLQYSGNQKIDDATPAPDQMYISDNLFLSEQALQRVDNFAVQPCFDACVEESQVSILPLIPVEIIEGIKHKEEKIDAATSPSDWLNISDHFFSLEKALPSVQKLAVQASSDACVEESHVSILPSIPEETTVDLRNKEENESMPTAGRIVGLTGLQIIEEPSVILSDVERELSLFRNKSMEEIDSDDNMSKLVHVTESKEYSAASPVISVPDGSFTGLHKLDFEEVKGIDDEGLLSELDAVGDFHVGEMRHHNSRIEQQCQSDVHFSDTLIYSESQESSSLLQTTDAIAIEDIRVSAEEGRFETSDFLEPVSKKPIHVESEVGPSEHVLDEAPLESMEIHSDPQYVEVSPLENVSTIGKHVSENSLHDIHMALKHATECIVKDPLDVMEPTDDSGLQKVEVRSLEDIHVALKLASEGTVEYSPDVMKAIDIPDIQEVEARSLEDIHMVEDSLELMEPKDTSDLQEVEASSLEDLHAALKLAAEGPVENSPNLMKPKYGSSEVDTTQVQNAKEIDKAAAAAETGAREVLDVQVPDGGIKELDHGSTSSASVTR